LSKEELTLPALESPQVNAPALEMNMAPIETAHLSDGDEEVTPLDLDNEANDGRMGGVSYPGDEVLHPPEAVPGVVDQWTLDDVRKMNYVKSHGRDHCFARHEETVRRGRRRSP
jgi:hypothetical protein